MLRPRAPSRPSKEECSSATGKDRGIMDTRASARRSFRPAPFDRRTRRRRLSSLLGLTALLSVLSVAALGCSSGSTGTTTTAAGATDSSTTQASSTSTTQASATSTTSAQTSTTAAAAGGLSGTWLGQYGGASQGTFTLIWAQSGSKLSGTIKISNPSTTFNVKGTVHGSAITFGTLGEGVITYTGSVSGNSMSGSYQAPTGGGSWSASKKS